MTHRLIFVCEANICRSPLMEHVIRSLTDAEQWHIASAGTRVGSGGRPMCRVSADIAGVGKAESEARHRSAALDIDEIRVAGLILTASRAERAEVATLLPAARSKTFTLREAVHLGSDPVGDGREHTPTPAEADEDERESLERYATALHHRRGFVAAPTSGRTLFGKRRPNAYDIPDAHHGSTREHRAMLERTVLDVERLHRQVSAFLARG